MSRQETFVAEIKRLVNEGLVLSPEAHQYLDALSMSEGGEQSTFTENGLAILKFIKENKNSYGNLFKAKDIGEAMGLSSKTVSGAARKLVSDGYLEKVGANPVVYMLTELGETINLNDNNN